MNSIQLRLLAAVEQLGRVQVSAHGKPTGEALRRLGSMVGEDEDTVLVVLDGLRADCALVEHTLEFDDIEPVAWWSVHPQLQG